MKVILLCLFFTSVVLSQNWNWIRVEPRTDDNLNRLQILQNAYSQIIPFNWYYSQEEIDASESPDDIYWLRTFASGPHVELGSMQVIPNYFSPVNGGVDRSPLYTVLDVLTADISAVFNYSLVGHTLTQVIDQRQNKFKTVGFNFGGLQQNQEINPSMHYFQVDTSLSFDRKPFPGYGRAFHSAVFDPEWDLNRVGAIYVFGGMSEIIVDTPVYVNDLFRINLPFLDDPVQDYTNLNITDMPQGGTIPTGRAGHSGVLYNGELIVFGGYDGVNTLGSVFAYNLETGIWSGRSGAPFERAFHSTHLVNDRMYVFGGSADTSIHNDLHYYDITNDLWVEVPTTVSIQPRIGHSGFSKGNSLLIQGGTDSSSTVYGDWWFLEVDGPECLSYCSTVEECVSDQLECDSYALCEDSESFRCNNGVCYDDWADCPIDTCAEETCWNGLCASSQDQCAPFPSCPYGVARCDDGTCSTDCESDEVECSDETTLCADGTCREICMPYLGCLPNINNTLCHAGHCSDSLATCQSDAPEDCGSNLPCWDDACRSTCDSVLFRTSTVNQEFVITVEAESENTGSAYDVFPEGLPSIDPLSQTSEGLGVLLVSNNSPQNRTLTGRIKPVGWDLVSSVGPMPYWDNTFDSKFFISTVAMLEMDGVDLSEDDIQVRLLLKLQPKRDEDLSYCFAHAVEWYWHEFDAVEWGPNAELPYFVEFREYYDPDSNSTDTEAIKGIETPALRWKCATTEGYPYTITSSAFYVDFAGNYLDEWSPVAVILNPVQPSPAYQDISLVSYLIAAVVGAVFLGLLTTMLLQTFCGEDADDCCVGGSSYNR